AVYEVRTHTREPVGHWVTFVDAESGEVVAWYNDVRFLTGTVSATHDDRFPGNGTVTSPVKGARVTNGNAAVTTDAAGGFNVPNGTSYQTHFLSSPINLADSQGNVGLNFDASNPNPVWNATNGSIAAIDTFVFLNEVRDTFAAVVPTLPYTTAALDGTVNIDDACNAYYDGTVNFFRSGQGCQNTGRIADVVYHEWGHGLHFELIVTGTFDGALSEGAGDTTSFLMTGDSELAPGFFTSGGALRSADNDRTFPTDIVNEVHEDGLIYAGAMWDTYTGLIGGYGGPAATDITSDLFTSMLRGGPDIESSIDEALFADDDDGDLSNGTPHACYIVPAFAGHGLGQLGSTTTSFSVGHVPDAFHDPSRPVGIDLEVVGPPGCGADLAAGTGTLSWRANGGVWSDVPLTVTGTLASGSIPAQPPGTFVEYHAVVEGAGQTLEAPTNGWRNPFSFYVGSVLEVRCDDFEGDDGGFTHALLAGENTDGADDWQHGAPNGQSGDPVTAHSGSFVWGNDLGYDGYNGAYQANRNNRLTGPVVELGHYEGAFLQYWRWLTVEDAAYDQASILANDTVVWTNVVGAGEDHHLDRQWAPHVVDLGDPRGSVQVAFDLVSDGGVELGGWTVDDVCVYVPATANNRLGVTDFQAGEGGTGTVALTWTNPVHGPLAEVRVVRGKDGDCPTGPDDGDVVFFATAVELGAPMVAQDAVPSTDTYCYAVFPGDGSAFLGWAVEGWNVDTGSAEVAATPEQIEEQAEENGLDAFEAQYGSISGCGCRAGGPAGWLALLAVLPALRRRQVSR
ncbi:MAG: hypothetical protein KC656_08575, partial [Myxococcales bacterium]|nr:hypothetical protein [Myxococcales bacterium]